MWLNQRLTDLSLCWRYLLIAVSSLTIPHLRIYLCARMSVTGQNCLISARSCCTFSVYCCTAFIDLFKRALNASFASTFRFAPYRKLFLLPPPYVSSSRNVLAFSSSEGKLLVCTRGTLSSGRSSATRGWNFGGGGQIPSNKSSNQQEVTVLRPKGLQFKAQLTCLFLSQPQHAP